MQGKSELIGNIVVLEGDVECLRERCAIKDAEIKRLTAYQNETALAWTKLTESQEEEIAKLTERCAAYKGQVESGAIEIERLQEAKRRALAIADERSKENVRLRAGIDEATDLLVRLIEGAPPETAAPVRKFIDAFEQTIRTEAAK